MTAVDALRRARDAGVAVVVDGDGVVLKAAHKPPQEIIDDLRRHKAELTALLDTRPTAGAEIPEPDDAAEWTARLQTHRDRLVRLGYPIETATALAHGHVLNEMHRALVAADPRDPKNCAGCGKALAGPQLDTGDGARVHDEDDHRCLVAYGRRWRKRAGEQLDAVGIVVPADLIHLN